jgi:hypothetical protein
MTRPQPISQPSRPPPARDGPASAQPVQPDLPADGRDTHWYFGPRHPADPEAMFCPEYVMGDNVVDATNGTPGQVDCPVCLEWMHA